MLYETIPVGPISRSPNGDKNLRVDLTPPPPPTWLLKGPKRARFYRVKSFCLLDGAPIMWSKLGSEADVGFSRHCKVMDKSHHVCSIVRLIAVGEMLMDYQVGYSA